MAIQEDLTKRVHTLVDTLSQKELHEVRLFLDYLQYKAKHEPAPATPYTPVTLGGLWEGITLHDEDISEVRRDMWDGFGEGEL